MSWASYRRILYLTGVILFFVIIIGGPIAYKILNIPQTCHDGILNHGETNIDRGGPCLLLDERTLVTPSIVWARALVVREGSYNAVAYIQNPNKVAGVETAQYVFRLYDSNHILLAERKGETYIMPAGITPIFEGAIETGKRAVAHTTFEFTNTPLVWKWMHSTIGSIAMSGILLENKEVVPQLSAVAYNSDVSSITGISFVAVVFDTIGNAMSASATTLPTIGGLERTTLRFTWPTPFQLVVGSTDVLPKKTPLVDREAEQ